MQQLGFGSEETSELGFKHRAGRSRLLDTLRCDEHLSDATRD